MANQQPKYKIGDRFTVMDTVKCEIIEIIGNKQIAYIFKLVGRSQFQSVLTEKELNILVNQST